MMQTYLEYFQKLTKLLFCKYNNTTTNKKIKNLKTTTNNFKKYDTSRFKISLKLSKLIFLCNCTIMFKW